MKDFSPTTSQESFGDFWSNDMKHTLNQSAGWPSKTGEPFGGGRDNNPQRK
jgi:hypothetical protein